MNLDLYINIIPSELTEIILSYIDSNNIDNIASLLTQKINWNIVNYYNSGEYSKRSIDYSKYKIYLGLSEFRRILGLDQPLDALRYLQTLELIDRELVEIPTQIIYLPYLKKLYLNKNKLTSIPPQITNLKNLEVLHMSNNQITEISPGIGNLVNLRELFLDSNLIRSIPPEIGNLVNLRQLSLIDNDIKEIPVEMKKLVNQRKTLIFLKDDETIGPSNVMKYIQNLTSIYPPIIKK